MAGFPDSAVSRASSRKRRLKLAFRFTPPWQEMQCLLIMGFTWVLKSTFSGSFRHAERLRRTKKRPKKRVLTIEVCSGDQNRLKQGRIKHFCGIQVVMAGNSRFTPIFAPSF
jgi:hypothetical protein